MCSMEKDLLSLDFSKLFTIGLSIGHFQFPWLCFPRVVNSMDFQLGDTGIQALAPQLSSFVTWGSLINVNILICKIGLIKFTL